MLCAKCGTPAAPDDKFCYVCGNPVNTGNEDIPVPKLVEEAPDIDIKSPKVPETGGKGKLIVGLLGLAVICFALAVSKFGSGVMFPQTAQTRQQQNTSVQRKPSKESDLNIPMSTDQLKAFRESQKNNPEMSQEQKQLAIAVVNAHLIANDNPTKKQLLNEIKNEIGKLDGFYREMERISDALGDQKQASATVPAPSQPSTQQTSQNVIQSGASQQNQESPKQVLQKFHQYITNKNYRKAYNCLSDDFQNSMSYEGWKQGFRTTVSSKASNIQVSSQTETETVLTYTLKAEDNPGGTHYFQGTAVLVKTPNGWKIDDIMNKTM